MPLERPGRRSTSHYGRVNVVDSPAVIHCRGCSIDAAACHSACVRRRSYRRSPLSRSWRGHRLCYAPWASPACKSGPISQAAGESWRTVDKALRLGSRGLTGHSSLAKLFDKHRPDWYSGRRMGRENSGARLDIQRILTWADAYYLKYQHRPTRKSGPIPGSSETWSRVDSALKGGNRGLAEKSSLRQLLDEHRPKWSPTRRLERLTAKQILSCADQFYAQHDKRPSLSSGRIPGTSETWKNIDNALRNGLRGLPSGSSLSQFLNKHRPKWPSSGAWRNRRANPLGIKQVLRWADSYHASHGRRPIHTAALLRVLPIAGTRLKEPCATAATG